MSEPRPIIIVHTRTPEKPDEWPSWGLTDESLVALFHAGGCIPGRMVSADDVKKACGEARIGPVDVDVCVACGYELDKVYRAMQAMINCSPSRPIYIAVHHCYGGKEETRLREAVELSFADRDRRGIAVYSIGDAKEHLQLIHDYTEAARQGLEVYEAALGRLTRFLLADLLEPDTLAEQTE